MVTLGLDTNAPAAHQKWIRATHTTLAVGEGEL